MCVKLFSKCVSRRKQLNNMETNKQTKTKKKQVGSGVVQIFLTKVKKSHAR